MGEHVLPEAGAVGQGADHGYQFRVEIGDSHLQEGLVTDGPDALVQHPDAAGVHLLDSCRMNTPVGDQVHEGQPGGFPSHRVKAAEQHRLRGVVHHHVDSGDLLEGPDVAALTPDDPPLHLVAGKVDAGNHRLAGLLCRAPLDGGHDYRPGPLVRFLLRGLLDVPGQGGS